MRGTRFVKVHADRPDFESVMGSTQNDQSVAVVLT
jgi:hypothetical protein